MIHRGHKIKFGDIDFDEYGYVEEVETENLSSSLLWFERALLPPKLQGRKFELKEVNVQIRIVDKSLLYDDYRKVEKLNEELVGLVFTKETRLLQWNYKFSDAVLINADSESTRRNTKLLNLTFIVVEGIWYGEEKSATLDSSFSNQGIIDTSKAIMTIRPNNDTVVLKDGKGNILTFDNLSTTLDLIVDLQNKTAKQAGVHVQINLASDFFEIKKGTNLISITGGTGSIKFREVIAL